MALQLMPILDQLTAPGARMADGGSDGDYPMTESGIAAIRSATRVYLSNDQYQLGSGRTWPIAPDQVGPQRLPFSNLWIETDALGVNLAAHAASIVDERGRDGYMMRFWFDRSPVGLRPSLFPIRAVVHTDRNGQVERTEFSHLDYRTERVTPVDSQDMDEALSVASPFMVAVGLMNCRNVTLEQHERPANRFKKQRRERPPKLDYHTIVLPGTRSSSGVPGEHRDVMPQHKVRGHFKTYTDDAPLMGKHVGTYWWGWQVRGNKRNGITVTDYRLSPMPSDLPRSNGMADA